MLYQFQTNIYDDDYHLLGDDAVSPPWKPQILHNIYDVCALL
jgi:hypothetical protein